MIEYKGLIEGGDDGVLAILTGVIENTPNKEMWTTLDQLNQLLKDTSDKNDKNELLKAIKDYQHYTQNPFDLPSPPSTFPKQKNLF